MIKLISDEEKKKIEESKKELKKDFNALLKEAGFQKKEQIEKEQVESNNLVNSSNNSIDEQTLFDEYINKKRENLRDILLYELFASFFLIVFAVSLFISGNTLSGLGLLLIIPIVMIITIICFSKYHKITFKEILNWDKYEDYYYIGFMIAGFLLFAIIMIIIVSKTKQ